MACSSAGASPSDGGSAGAPESPRCIEKESATRAAKIAATRLGGVGSLDAGPHLGSADVVPGIGLGGAAASLYAPDVDHEDVTSGPRSSDRRSAAGGDVAPDEPALRFGQSQSGFSDGASVTYVGSGCVGWGDGGTGLAVWW